MPTLTFGEPNQLIFPFANERVHLVGELHVLLKQLLICSVSQVLLHQLVHLVSHFEQRFRVFVGLAELDVRFLRDDSPPP